MFLFRLIFAFPAPIHTGNTDRTSKAGLSPPHITSFLAPYYKVVGAPIILQIFSISSPKTLVISSCFSSSTGPVNYLIGPGSSPRNPPHNRITIPLQGCSFPLGLSLGMAETLDLANRIRLGKTASCENWSGSLVNQKPMKSRQSHRGCFSIVYGRSFGRKYDFLQLCSLPCHIFPSQQQ